MFSKLFSSFPNDCSGFISDVPCSFSSDDVPASEERHKLSTCNPQDLDWAS